MSVSRIRLPMDMGRRYAAVCGDYNPIHTSSWLAPLFGQRGAIAHGIAAVDLVFPALVDALLDCKYDVQASSSSAGAGSTIVDRVDGDHDADHDADHDLPEARAGAGVGALEAK